MAYLNRKSYRLEKQVLYNNVGTNSLYGQHIKPENIATVGGYKRIFEGSVWTNKGILKRASLVSPYTAGGDTLIVNYPYPFAVGDVLYEIGTSTEDAIAENGAIVSGSATELGTVTAISQIENYQATEVTLNSIVVNDVISFDIEGQTVSYTATTTDIAEILKGLKKQFTGGLRSHHSVLDFLEITEDGTKLSLTAKEPGEIFTVKGEVLGTGTVEIEVTKPVGALTITPAAGNNSHEIGAKIGTIDQVPLGIIANQFYLSDDEGLPTIADIAAYDTANIYKRALPYLDGQVVAAIPTLKYIPVYGSDR